MRWLIRLGIGLVGLGVVGALAFNLFKPQIASRLYDRAVEQRVGVDRTADLPDGLHVYLCGTGSPMPDANRAGPCLGVLAGEKGYVFDVGSGGVRNLGSMGFPIARLEGVYLTHLHSDHIDGLGELLLQAWVGGGRSAPLPISGPVGTTEVVNGFNAAYRIDSTYRVAHHGPEIANPAGFGGASRELPVPVGPAGTSIIFEDGPLKVTAIRVEHAPVEPAFGYRIDYKDRSVSISGDTIYHPGFVAASSGVDLMLHEALDPEMVAKIGNRLATLGNTNTATIMADILDYHASPEDAARTAAEADARHLVLYHLVPPLPVKLVETVFLGDAPGAFDGPITVGEDGMIFTLPAGGIEISQTRGY
ncbi:MAG: MBL fold metallo-hydrolase [Pseudomonadota bacterium]